MIRVPIQTKPTYEEAALVKNRLIMENERENYQIRRRSKGFTIVERIEGAVKEKAAPKKKKRKKIYELLD